MNLFRIFQARIQWRLTALIIILVLAAVGFAAWRILPGWQDEITERANVEEQTYVELEATRLDTFLLSVRQDIDILSQMQSVGALAEALATDDTELLRNLLRERVAVDFFVFSNSRQIYDQIRMFDLEGNEIVRVDFDGATASIRADEDLQYKGDRGYFQGTITLAEDEVYLSRLNLNREGSPPTIEGNLTDDTMVPVLRYGIPLYVDDPETGERVLVGAIVTNIFARNMLDLIEPNADDARTFLIDAEGYYLQNSQDPLQTFGFEPDIATVGGVEDARLQNDYAEDESDRVVNATSTGSLTTEDNQLVHYQRIVPPGAPSGYYWILGNVRNQDVAFENVNQATTVAIIGVLGALLIAGFLTVLVVGQVTRPLADVTQAAHTLAEGDLSLRVKHQTRQDELGELSRAFNQMADQLEDSLQNLESRVAESTRSLQAVVDLNVQISSILDMERLLRAAANLTKDRFGLYHAHIYLFDSQNNLLSLVAGAGYVGRQMVSQRRTIPFDSSRSIVASAAQSRKPVVVNDTAASPDFLPHQLLPDTQAELAIPLISRGQLIGVLDVQSDEVDFFNERLLEILQVLAGQIANALVNVRLYEDASRTSRHEQALSQISQAIQGATDVDDVLQVAVKELGKALKVPHTAIELQLAPQDDN